MFKNDIWRRYDLKFGLVYCLYSDTNTAEVSVSLNTCKIIEMFSLPDFACEFVFKKQQKQATPVFISKPYYANGIVTILCTVVSVLRHDAKILMVSSFLACYLSASSSNVLTDLNDRRPRYFMYTYFFLTTANKIYRL